MTTAQPAGTLYDLHVRPKEGTDPSVLIKGAKGSELDRLAHELAIFNSEFVEFVRTWVIPRVNTSPHASGVPERITLVRGNNDTTVSDYLMFIDGMVSGDGGVLELIETRYALRVVYRGNYVEGGSWVVPARQPAPLT